MNDKQRIDWLQKHGQGLALLSDDQGHWAVSGDGMQSVSSNPPEDCHTTFFVEKREWKKTVRKAIDAAIRITVFEGP